MGHAISKGAQKGHKHWNLDTAYRAQHLNSAADITSYLWWRPMCWTEKFIAGDGTTESCKHLAEAEARWTKWHREWVDAIQHGHSIPPIWESRASVNDQRITAGIDEQEPVPTSDVRWLNHIPKRDNIQQHVDVEVVLSHTTTALDVWPTDIPRLPRQLPTSVEPPTTTADVPLETFMMLSPMSLSTLIAELPSDVLSQVILESAIAAGPRVVYSPPKPVAKPQQPPRNSYWLGPNGVLIYDTSHRKSAGNCQKVSIGLVLLVAINAVFSI